MINFVSNALKFSYTDSVVEVRLEGDLHPLKSSEGRYLKMKVQIVDCGKGISTEGLKSLFLDFSSLQEHQQ